MPKTFLNVSNAAKLLGMSRRQFRRKFIEAPGSTLQPLRFGGRRLIFLRADVERLKENS